MENDKQAHINFH